MMHYYGLYILNVKLLLDNCKALAGGWGRGLPRFPRSFSAPFLPRLLHRMPSAPVNLCVVPGGEFVVPIPVPRSVVPRCLRQRAFREP